MQFLLNVEMDEADGVQEEENRRGTKLALRLPYTTRHDPRGIV